jgi:exodeoxyribonuclease VII large subunit
MASSEIIFSVSDFVAVLNQTLDYAYPDVTIVGELSNFRVSKNRWVYFDLKDEYSSVKFFGTIYMLPGPLEDGLMVQVSGTPRLHQQFGFSVNMRSIQPVGEGSLKKAAALLEAKLTAEGLFDESRKRLLPHPPKRIGLITSSESAAFHDFMKILNARWGGVDVQLFDVQVQGEAAPSQIVSAIEFFNSHAEPVDVLVVTRGGGSAEDLAAFSTEQVTRAVAGSRIPTLVAIGHEIDISLAELAADRRASTPSNAAELLVPDKQHELRALETSRQQLSEALRAQVSDKQAEVTDKRRQLHDVIQQLLSGETQFLSSKLQLLEALSPHAAMRRGYALVTSNGKVVRSVGDLKLRQTVNIDLIDGKATAEIKEIT